MDILIILSLALNAAIFAILIWFILSRNRQSPHFDPNDVTQPILASLNQSQMSFLSQILESIATGNQSQNRELNSSLQALEKRFGEIQVNLTQALSEEMAKIQLLQNYFQEQTKLSFQEQTQAQNLQFEQLQNRNQAALAQLQAAVREQLAAAVQNLIDLNKTELKAVQDLNRQSLEIISKTNQDKLSQIQGEIERKLNENLLQNLKSFEDVTKNLGHLQSTAQKMIDSTSSIDKLNNIFERTSSKSFGNFGEKYLESLLSEYINPQHWAKQVKVPHSSDIIDFVVSIGDQKIGIDSKFPVTKYQDYLDAGPDDKKAKLKIFLSGILQMATDIQQKYTKEGFVGSLLMYLPSDSMYCEVVNSAHTMEQLQKHKVTLTSPTTILPLIALIHEYEFKVNVQERAGDIIQGLGIVKKNIISFREEFRKLGEKIRLAQQNYDTADRSLITVQNTVMRLETVEVETALEPATVTTSQQELLS